MNLHYAGLFLLFFSTYLSADCVEAQLRLQALEQQLKQGYRLNDLPKLQRQQQLLSSRYQKCLDQQQKKSAKTNKRAAENKHALATLANGPVLSVTNLQLNAPYQGEQQQAWLNFYREPEHCFGVREMAKIVHCAEQRQQAKAQFDRQWQQKLAQSPPK